MNVSFSLVVINEDMRFQLILNISDKTHPNKVGFMKNVISLLFWQIAEFMIEILYGQIQFIFSLLQEAYDP